MKKERNKKKVEILNRKGKFNYIYLETYTCGIVLKGGEVKSIREGKCSISDSNSYCYLNKGEVWLKNVFIKKYVSSNKSFEDYEEQRERKLLLNKKEITRIENELKNKGLTLIPSKIFINDRGMVKVVINISKGKKLYDKRETIKQRDLEREINYKF